MPATQINSQLTPEQIKSLAESFIKLTSCLTKYSELTENDIEETFSQNIILLIKACESLANEWSSTLLAKINFGIELLSKSLKPLRPSSSQQRNITLKQAASELSKAAEKLKELWKQEENSDLIPTLQSSLAHLKEIKEAIEDQLKKSSSMKQSKKPRIDETDTISNLRKVLYNNQKTIVGKNTTPTRKKKRSVTKKTTVTKDKTENQSKQEFPEIIHEASTHIAASPYARVYIINENVLSQNGKLPKAKFHKRLITTLLNSGDIITITSDTQATKSLNPTIQQMNSEGFSNITIDKLIYANLNVTDSSIKQFLTANESDTTHQFFVSNTSITNNYSENSLQVTLNVTAFKQQPDAIKNQLLNLLLTLAKHKLTIADTSPLKALGISSITVTSDGWRAIPLQDIVFVDNDPRLIATLMQTNSEERPGVTAVYANTNIANSRYKEENPSPPFKLNNLKRTIQVKIAKIPPSPEQVLKKQADKLVDQKSYYASQLIEFHYTKIGLPAAGIHETITRAMKNYASTTLKGQALSFFEIPNNDLIDHLLASAAKAVRKTTYGTNPGLNAKQMLNMLQSSLGSERLAHLFQCAIELRRPKYKPATQAEHIIWELGQAYVEYNNIKSEAPVIHGVEQASYIQSGSGQNDVPRLTVKGIKEAISNITNSSNSSSFLAPIRRQVGNALNQRRHGDPSIKALLYFLSDKGNTELVTRDKVTQLLKKDGVLDDGLSKAFNGTTVPSDNARQAEKICYQLGQDFSQSAQGAQLQL